MKIFKNIYIWDNIYLFDYRYLTFTRLNYLLHIQVYLLKNITFMTLIYLFAPSNKILNYIIKGKIPKF